MVLLSPYFPTLLPLLRRTGQVAALIFSVAGCVDERDTNPGAVADTLVYATKAICLPYVADEADIDSLVRKPGIAKRVDDVHGTAVVRYLIDAPGHPMVTPAGDSCWILANGTPEFADLVLKQFRQRLNLSGYKTSAPQAVGREPGLLVLNSPLGFAVTCVHGRRTALVSTNNPDFRPPAGFPVINGDEQINVDLSDASKGCG